MGFELWQRRQISEDTSIKAFRNLPPDSSGITKDFWRVVSGMEDHVLDGGVRKVTEKGEVTGVIKARASSDSVSYYDLIRVRVID
jgi:hypothetical protein